MCYLVVGRPETPSDILVIKYLHLEAEILLEILDDHYQERQLDAQGLGGVSWTSDVGRADVAAHNLQHARLNVAVSDALDVTIAHCRPIERYVRRHCLLKPFTQGHPSFRMSGDLPCLSQICKGLLPMLYRIERNPD